MWLHSWWSDEFCSGLGGEDPWMWRGDEGRPQNSCGSDLVILAPKRRGWRDDPQEGYGGGWRSHRPPCGWIKNILPLSLSFPPSLSLSLLLSFLSLGFFFKLPARQRKDPITLYNIPVSQIHGSSLPAVRKVKWWSKVTGCLFLQPRGSGALLIRTHQVWIFQKRCLQKSERTRGLLFFSPTRWPEVFLLRVVDSPTLLLSKHLPKTCCYGV